MPRNPAPHVLRHLHRLASAEAVRDLSDGELLERFRRLHEETAFALLLQRHGPMVLGVCRRIVRDAHAAEDAFQATFLVLARRAAGIRKQTSVASWLYGVARRVAAKARVRAARQRSHERQWADLPRPEPCDQLSWQELCGVLDEEVGRLPEKYRAPVVLCYLQEKTHDQAARELGCPRTSLSSRLDRARALLHERLRRRGIGLSAAALAVVLTEKATAAPVPALLTLSTVRAALPGATSAAGLSAEVAALVKSGVPGATATRLTTGLAVLVAAGLLAAGGYRLAGSGPSPDLPDGPAVAAENSAPPQVEAKPLAGVVVDAAGKPVADASVWLTVPRFPDGKIETLDQGKTGADGRFRLTIPARWFNTEHGLRQELGLIAFRPGLRPAGLGFSRTFVPPAADARLVLGPAAETTLQVNGPNGGGLGGARAEVVALNCDKIEGSEDQARAVTEPYKLKPRPTPLGFAAGRTAVSLPDDLIRHLAVDTDPRGVARFPQLARADLGGVRVRAPDGSGGTQVAYLNLFTPKEPPPEFPASFTLRPAGRVSGRFTAKTPGAAKGILVRFQSQDNSSGPVGQLIVIGRAEAKAEADGRFEVPALAHGSLMMHLAYPDGAAVRAVEPAFGSLTLKPGEQLPIEMPLVPAVRIKGVVRERGTGKPVASVAVRVGYGSGFSIETVQTDADGRYTCLVPPGPVYRVPQGAGAYVPPSQAEAAALGVTVPAGVAEHDVPPIELTRLAALRGTAVDEAGKPVAGATVYAQWLGPNLQFNIDANTLHEETLRTNERGEFQLDRLDPKTDIRVRAGHRDAFMTKLLVLRPDPAKPVTLRLVKGTALSLRGRVRDPAGKPVSGARVQVWVRRPVPSQFLSTPRLVAFDGDVVVRTDAQGRFETPRELEPDGEYRVIVEADGAPPEPSGWLPVGGERPLAFPELTVRRARTVAGRVLDRRGQPVAGARVLQVGDRKRVTTTTDGEGRFTLPSVPDGAAPLFVEKAGFRFHGQADATVTDIVLTRADEPVDEQRTTLPSLLTRKERQDLAARILAPGLKPNPTGKAEDRMRALEVLVRIDPARALAQAENEKFPDPLMRDAVRRAVAKRLAEDNLDEARALVETMKDPSLRSFIYSELCDTLPADKRAEKLALAEQAVVHARAVSSPGHRLVYLARGARRLRDLGKAEAATKLLREVEAVARSLPVTGWSAYARGVYAEELAEIDLPAALALIKDLNERGEYDRHHGNIAHRLAGKDPAAAERVLGLVGKQKVTTTQGGTPYDNSLARPEWTVRVCYRMAGVDLERARRLADGITNPYYKARAYGVMTQALAKTKPAVATELLRRAFDGCAAQVETGEDRFNNAFSAGVIAASLLPVAEAIDPRLVPEFFWRALSFRAPPLQSDDEFQLVLGDAGDAALALFLARYDRAVARQLLDGVRPRSAGLLKSRHSRTFLAALALVDPRVAVAWFEGLPAGAEKERERPDAARTLLLEGDERWREAHRHLGEWYVDDEDY
jgi:RNA polymerase sigma factor (sigma-70 family)